jgi:hypothetical protein
MKFSVSISFLSLLFLIQSGCGPVLPTVHPDIDETICYRRQAIPPGKKLAIAFEDLRTTRETAYSPGLFLPNKENSNIIDIFESRLAQKLYKTELFISVEKLPQQIREGFVELKTSNERIDFIKQSSSADLLLLGQFFHLVTCENVKGTKTSLISRGTLKYQLIDLRSEKTVISGIFDRYREAPPFSSGCIVADAFKRNIIVNENRNRIEYCLTENLVVRIKDSFMSPKSPNINYFDVMESFDNRRKIDISKYVLYKKIELGSFAFALTSTTIPLLIGNDTKAWTYAGIGIGVGFMNAVYFGELQTGHLRAFPIFLGTGAGFAAGWFSANSPRSRDKLVPLTTITGCLVGWLFSKKFGVLETEVSCREGLKN